MNCREGRVKLAEINSDRRFRSNLCLCVCVYLTGVLFNKADSFCLVDQGLQWTMDSNIRGSTCVEPQASVPRYRPREGQAIMERPAVICLLNGSDRKVEGNPTDLLYSKLSQLRPRFAEFLRL
ncbi:hypothetical protein RRG08_030076 [Elysia crispata]|uniref:Uncharacterized protein n=1 Tax=Elysia crispata TaxID=231223 RepID=A0AAE0ZR06_9GAST|nr:hypothetical protein RRG08_030076 [Elysia crispata]